MDPNCLFCKIVAGEIPAYQIYEDDDFLAFLDINPINLGHTLLIPKIHAHNLFDLPTETLTKLGPVLQKVGQAVKAGIKADGLNLGMNNEAQAGQLIFHAHFHLIPRFENDGFKHWQGQGSETKTDFEKTQTAIKKELAS
ncbi:MAG: HIT family protein [Candidatus Paceibacterota bacterium]|jgi:histidine triad (HIT) family protein